MFKKKERCAWPREYERDRNCVGHFLLSFGPHLRLFHSSSTGLHLLKRRKKNVQASSLGLLMSPHVLFFLSFTNVGPTAQEKETESEET